MASRRRRRIVERHPSGPPTREEIDALEERLAQVERKARMGIGVSGVLSSEPDVDDSYLYEWEGNAATATQASNADTVGGFPVDDIPYITDGIAPASSPAPTVRGTLGALVVEWDAISNPDIVTYEVHISETTGFTPDATTRIAEKRGSGPIYLRALPDGTLLEYWADPPTNSVPKVYYVVIVAKDADGSAAASTEASGSMDQAGTGDILANAITAEHLAATIILATIFKTAASGQRVEFDVDGIRLYDSDGTTVLVNIPTDGTDPFFSAELDARGIDIDASNASWRSVNWLPGVAPNFPIFSITASDPSGTGDDCTADLNAFGNDAAGDASLSLTAYNAGDPQATVAIEAGPSDHSSISLLAKDSGGTEVRTLLDSDGSSQYVQLEGSTAVFRIEYITVSVNLPNIAGHSSTTVTPTISGLAVDDLCVFIGRDAGGGGQMKIEPESPVCTVADQITLRVYNADSAAADAPATNYHFLVIHRS